MKQLLVCIVVILSCKYSIGAEPEKHRIAYMQFANSLFFDECMDEYNALTAINEEGYDAAVQNCYNVYQYPYNMLCHGEAIMVWNDYQEQIFEYLVICQNGNPAKSKKEDTR